MEPTGRANARPMTGSAQSGASAKQRFPGCAALHPGYKKTRTQRERKSMERLKGKTAMVVGAGSIGPGWGNGKATAVTFAREGAQVFCVDRNAAAARETVEIITGEGGKAAAFTADVSREAEVEAMVSACL